MPIITNYDVSITGGGLAGLSLSILLAKKGYNVALFEKEQYPFHKVCGEYISNESKPFLESVGIPVDTMDLPKINTLKVSSPSGNLLKCTLSPGGFGISRFLLDQQLCNIARSSGVSVFENSKVSSIIFNNGTFQTTINDTVISSSIAIGSYGKRSNLDVKLSRTFIKKKQSKLNNYIGIKYHIKGVFDEQSIALHNFKNGYCGISKIENDEYCLCYLTTAKNLKESNNSIEIMEQNILSKNPLLKNIFLNSHKVFSAPITISQISFDKKETAKDNILMIGDAAGLITPLCGNGMSMALRSSQIASTHIDHFLQKKISLKDVLNNYNTDWNKEFEMRLKTGRLIQGLFGKTIVTNLFISIMKKMPFLTQQLIKRTHGKTF